MTEMHPIFGGDLRDELRAAAAYLVDYKHRTDGATCSFTGPWEFVRSAIPFIPQACGDLVPGRVPTSLVVGESSKWDIKFLDARQISARKSAVLVPANPECPDESAQYDFIAPLGLFVAHEGKNRVRFLAVLGEPLIPALVSERGYPHPSRIARYSLPVNGSKEVFAVLDSRWVCWLKHYSAASGLLDAYGIAHLREWTVSMPDPASVIAAFHDSSILGGQLLFDPMAHAGAPPTMTRIIVDLDTLQQPTHAPLPWYRRIFG